MRLLATLVVLLAAIYLHLHLRGVQRNTKDDRNIFYYTNGRDGSPNIAAYATLMIQLRSRLSGTAVRGIGVTRPREDVPPRERFIQVKLEIDHTEDPRITVIIDTVNVYVMGYLVGSIVFPTLHYLDQSDPRDSKALFQAFPRTNCTHRRLGFTGNYRSLPPRNSTYLGHFALNQAIRDLYSGESQRHALLVIIQMVPEAVRIMSIEHRIMRNMALGPNFIPDPMVISLENNWSHLSDRIQSSTGDSGRFINGSILIRNTLNELVPIGNADELPRVGILLAVMLYRCIPRAIRMPVPVAVGADDYCPYGEPITNIIGWDGQCLDVKESRYYDGNGIVLWACGNAQYNQLWTFKSDGTIRSNGKCLTTNGYTSGNTIVIFDCDTAAPEATQWILSSAGTIMNPKSGLVITADTSTPGTVLTVAEDNNSSCQAWSAGNYTQPTRNYISGFREMCLQAGAYNGSTGYTPVWLANCVIGTEPSWQQWALYGDSTIRLYRDRTLCVTSRGVESLDEIILFKCHGWKTQRWTFMADGTILNPYARLVMEVDQCTVSLQKIILYKPTGNPNQNWWVF